MRSPWWTYADADASYAASGLNLMLGRDVPFVDHPGLPLTEAVAIAFGAQVVVEERSLSERARLAFVDRTLLDLDTARGTFRGVAIAIYLAGALLAFFLAARLFGHWSWGFAAGLLWVAAPGLAAMSIQLRPDVALAVLTLVFGFAVARAVESRSAAWYAAAAGVVGLATMMKLHALALLPALVLASFWRPASDADVRSLRRRARAWIDAHRAVAAAFGGGWLLVAVLVNAGRLPFTPTDGELLVLVVGAAVLAAAFAVGRLVPRLGVLTGALVGGFAAGALVPVTISIPEGLAALARISLNISGQGVQEGVDPFSTPLRDLYSVVGGRVVLLFVVAAGAGVLGLVRRDPRPVVWATGALGMGAMAFARPPNVHYFAPSFVLAGLALLWVVQRTPRTRTPLLLWPVVLYLVLPGWDARNAPAAEQRQFAELVAPAKAYVEGQLRPGEIALVPSYWPFADARYFELVQIYVEHSPNYPYRFLPTTAAVRPFARIRNLRPRYFVGPQAVGLSVGQRVELGELGVFTIVPSEGPELVAEIVQGPGVTEAW